jgi:hypothetical protein
MKAQQRIARPTMTQPPRARRIAGHRTGQRGDASAAQKLRPVGWVKTQALILGRQHANDVRQWCGRRGGEDQFFGFIFQNAGQGRNIELRKTVQRLADAAAGAARHNFERRFAGARGTHEVDNSSFVGNPSHQ